MSILIEHVGHVASFVTSLTIVGGALMWVYNKFISAPREKRRQRESDKRQRDMIELITEKNKPLDKSIQRLNELLAESQADREKLNQIANVNTEMIEDHEERLDGHNVRLTVLETKNGIQKVAYREEHERRN